MIKKLFLLLLLLVSSLNAMDARQEQSPKAKALYEKAQQGNYDAAFDLARLYQTRLSDPQQAIY